MAKSSRSRSVRKTRRRPMSAPTGDRWKTSIESTVGTMEGDLSALKTDVAVLKTDVAVLKTDVGVLKTDVGVLKVDVKELRADLSRLEVKVDANEDASCRRDAQILKTMELEVVRPLAELRDFVKRVADNHEVRITALERG